MEYIKKLKEQISWPNNWEKSISLINSTVTDNFKAIFCLVAIHVWTKKIEKIKKRNKVDKSKLVSEIIKIDSVDSVHKKMTIQTNFSFERISSNGKTSII